jgi:hypothetical protein
VGRVGCAAKRDGSSGGRIWSAATSGIPRDTALARTGRKAVPRPAHSAALVTALQVAFCTKQVRWGSQRKPMDTGLAEVEKGSPAIGRKQGAMIGRNVCCGRWLRATDFSLFIFYLLLFISSCALVAGRRQGRRVSCRLRSRLTRISRQTLWWRLLW